MSLTTFPQCTPRFIKGNVDCSSNLSLRSVAHAPTMITGTLDFTDTGLNPMRVEDQIPARDYEY